MKQTTKLFTSFLLLLASFANIAAASPEYTAYLFAYFTGNAPGQEQIRFAISEDGFNYRALNGNNPIVDSKDISTSGGVRDPHIMRSADNKTFYMVVTDLYVPKMGWSNYAMTLMKSTDLIHWDSTVINIPQTYPETFGKVHRVWAPQTIYDPKAGKYMVYFSMKEGNDPDKIYYAYANKDFTGFESTPKQLYYPPANTNTRACIDGDIIYKDGKYYLFYKAEDGDPGIKLAISDQLTQGYKLYSSKRMDCSRHPVEGSGIFKLNNSNEWILMYDLYTQGGYQFTKSTDLLHFKVIDDAVSMNFHPRHGTVMPITGEELSRLIYHFGSIQDFFPEPTADLVRQNNVTINAKASTIHMPLMPNANIYNFDPQFKTIAGVKLSPKGPQNFARGPVNYTASIEGKEKAMIQVSADILGNPVLNGYYADPDIIYSNKTNKFYIYPTSDGFTGWSGTYFKTFSSSNLVTWKDEGAILNLLTDVSWANRNAWAPCIIERKINNQYKYFYYFTAAQKIGVAVADDPAGPFTDSGRPIVDFRPDGVRGGQEIDPDVFCDPMTNKYYLYWGNGYMAAAELSDDMLSIKKNTLKLLTPDRTYREGTHVFYRKGTYYFLWSQDDTRSPNYRVRYAIAPSPMGPLEIPKDNLVIARDDSAGIYGTGHNSTINIPGTDDWYIVYHRFTYPKGITMGDSAGYNREVCIDKINFTPTGLIQYTIPTHKGIAPVK